MNLFDAHVTQLDKCLFTKTGDFTNGQWIQKELYRAVPAGLCGMDDYGTMEGWYVTSVLGYGEVDPVSGYYEIGSPLFPKATIRRQGASSGTFTIEAHNVSDTNQYIQSATLNGKPLREARFRQTDMVAGGSLIFEMGPMPNQHWGIGPDHAQRQDRLSPDQ